MIADELTIRDTTQGPVFLRNRRHARPEPTQVQVIAPFVGGGFGPKIMLFYPEEVVIPWGGKLNRPIKWIEDRLEHFFATTHERGQTHDAEIALTSTAASSATRTCSCTTPAPIILTA